MSTVQERITGNGAATREEEGDNKGLLDKLLDNAQAGFDMREAAFMEKQISTAHKHPRTIKRFMDLATEFATLDQDVAESCSYSVPRDGKTIRGASIRLIEICVMAWGNLKVEARVVDIGQDQLKVAAVCWDLEANTQMGQDVIRRITKKNGQRYSEDMIVTTANAAMSIALRNAVMRIIPRAFIEKIRQKTEAIVRGDVATVSKRRDEAAAYWAKKGVDFKRMLAALGKDGIEDVDIDDLVTLRGFAVAIQENEATLEQCFPLLTTATKELESRIKGNGNGSAASATAEAPAAKVEEAAAPVTTTPKEEPKTEEPKPAAKKVSLEVLREQFQAECGIKGIEERTAMHKANGTSKNSSKWTSEEITKAIEWVNKQPDPKPGELFSGDAGDGAYQK